MDILQKYNEENPEIAPQTPQCGESEGYGALTCSIIYLSKGRIHNVRQANYILISIATIFLFTSFAIFFINGAGNRPHIVPSPVGDDPLRGK